MKPARIVYTLLLLVSTLPIAACATPVTYSAEAIEARVIDAETKQPLEGVVVVAHWVLEDGIHVDRVGDLMVLESIADKNGWFRFPAWGPIRHWGNSRLTYMDPEILVFKSGYEYRQLTNYDWATPEQRAGKAIPVRKSAWNGKTIALKPYTGTIQAYKGHFESLNKELERVATDNPEDCNWKKLPKTIAAIGRERKALEEKGVNPHTLFSIDKELILNDEHYTKKGKASCGSPKAFLQGIQQ